MTDGITEAMRDLDVVDANGRKVDRFDDEPAKRNLESALRSLDNMQQLVNRLTGKRGRAVAVNVGISADGFFTVYVTADARTDERAIGRAAMGLFSGAIFDQGHVEHRADLVRAVVAQQWRETFVLWFAVDGGAGIFRGGFHVWPGLPFFGFADGTTDFPAADDVVAEMLGER